MLEARLKSWLYARCISPVLGVMYKFPTIWEQLGKNNESVVCSLVAKERGLAHTPCIVFSTFRACTSVYVCIGNLGLE